MPSIPELDENDLLSLVQAGDPAAFEELMRRNSSSSYKLALSILRDRQEAEDAVQDSYCNAWRAIGSFHRDSKFSTWLCRIVTNQCLMRVRKLRRAKFLYLDDQTEDRTRLELADQHPTSEAALQEKEMHAQVRSEAAKLPPKMRDVLELRDLQQLPMSEVASRLDISVLAAKARLNRARMELRRRIDKIHRDEAGARRRQKLSVSMAH
jgi:RNA polymerase sigma-70 factor (ECF subfamily)